MYRDWIVYKTNFGKWFITDFWIDLGKCQVDDLTTIILQAKKRYQIHLKSDDGQIYVLLINKDADNESPFVAEVPLPKDLDLEVTEARLGSHLILARFFKMFSWA